MTNPYMPLYVDDYEAATAHLTAEEDGVYNRLLRLCWRTPGCSLPNDPAWIARKIRLSMEDYDRIARPLVAEFFKVAKGRIYQKRLREEHDAIARKKRMRKQAGKSGGIAKALKDKENTPSKRTDLLGHTRAFPEPYPEPKEYTPPTPPMGGAANDPDGTEKPKAKPKRSATPSPWFAAFFDRFWAVWPNKVDRKRAELALWKAWPTILPDPAAGENTAEGRCLTLLAAVAAYDAWRLAHDYKLSGPTPWINGARWADDYASAAKPKPKERFAI